MFKLKYIFAAALLCLVINSTQAQLTARSFGLAYSKNTRGGVTTFGNTVMNAVTTAGTADLTAMNETSDPNNGQGGLGFSQYGNDQSDMKQVDIDGLTLTHNSSSADLSLPTGTNTILFARLYWGGRIDSSAYGQSLDTLKKIRLRKGTSGNYTQFLAQDVDTILSTDRLGLVYQAYVDITSFVQANGAGTYTAADIPLTELDLTGGQYGGWAITVAYENQTLPYYSIRVYDGFAQVYNAGAAGTLSITLTGLNVPGTPLAADDAIMGSVAWEGDASLSGDYIKINNITVSNSLNPSTNFFNGSISKNAAFISSKNPNYSNQMGIDIDELNVGTGYNIGTNATSVNILFGTTADMYFPGVFTFIMKTKEPTVKITKTVNDANGNGFVDNNEILTYTLAGNNLGPDSAYNTYIIDTIPSNVTYVPGSLEVINAPGVTPGFKTDAPNDDQAFITTSNGKTIVRFNIGLGASASAGGKLPIVAGSEYLLRFKVKAAANATTVTNLGRIYGQAVNGAPYVDESTATIYLNTTLGTGQSDTACNSYSWNGTTFTQSGTYTFTYTNSSGNQITDTLYLTIFTPTASTTNVSVCSGQLPYTWNGLTFTQAGSQSITLTNAGGCDSIATLNLSIVSIDAGNDTSICAGGSVQLNATGGLIYSWSPATGLSNPNIANPIASPATTTTYVVTGQIQTNNLIVNGNFSQGNTGFTSSYNYAFPNLVEGQYYVGPNAQLWNPGMASCGDHTSGSTNMLLINGSTIPNVSIYCQTVNVQPNTTYEFSTWLVSFTTPVSLLQFSINGNLIGNTFSGSTTLCEWKQFYSTWNSGNNTTATICIVNQNTSALGNDFGLDDISFSALCTSTDSVTVTVRPPTSSTTNLSICSSELPYLWNGLTLTQGGTQSVTLTNAAGCDSVATLSLTIKQPTSSITDISICPNELPYLWNGLSITQTGMQTVILTNAAGCDSMAMLHLMIKQPTSSTTSVAVCENTLPYIWNGLNFTASGSYSVTLVNAAGCDSTAILDLVVNLSSSSLSTETACSSYSWNGNTYTQSGTYSVGGLINAAGCDSTAVLDLTINQPSSSFADVEVCPSELPYYWNGLAFSQGGSQTITLTNAAGCDSVATLTLWIKSVSSSYTPVSICSGQLPYSWNGQSYSAAGTYTAMLINAAGCDSITVLELSLLPAQHIMIDTNVCERDLPFVWNGNSYNQSTMISATFTNAEGCDSVVMIMLNVINCDPPCNTEDFNTTPAGWTLSQGARFFDYINPANNCTADKGIITPGVGGNNPAFIRTPLYTSSGARKLNISFDIFVFDANLKCNTWKNYNCPTSIDVFYIIGGVRYPGIIDFVLPPNGPTNSPSVNIEFNVGNNLPAGVQYSIEIAFKFWSGTGNCVQQNTKYVIDNFSVCEKQCATCPSAPSYAKAANAANNQSSVSTSVPQDINTMVKVWPIPSSGRIYYSSLAGLSVQKVEVIDAMGKMVVSAPYRGVSSLDLSALQSGNYYLRLFTDKGMVTRRISLAK